MSEQTALARPRADRIGVEHLLQRWCGNRTIHSVRVTASAVPCNERITMPQCQPACGIKALCLGSRWRGIYRYELPRTGRDALDGASIFCWSVCRLSRQPPRQIPRIGPLHHPPAYARRRWRLSIQRSARDNRRDPAGTRNTAQTDTAADPNSEDPTASASTRQTGSKPQNRQREALTAIPDRSRWGQVACWRTCVHSLVPTSGTHG